jgi:flagellar hook-associated protein 3 FlgL
MRIDTMTYINISLAGIQSNQSAIARLNQQIATGLSMLSGKDDPVNAVKALELGNRIALRTQFAANQDKVEIDLKYTNVVSQEMHSALNQARDLLTGISTSHDTALRNTHAEQLKGLFNHVMDLLNTRDPSGNSVFSGFETATVPFVNSSLDTASVTPTQYNGTAAPGGARLVEVENGRYVQANDNLAGVFLFADAAIVDPVQGGASHDVLENLAHAIINLPLNVGGTDEALLTEAELQGYRDVLTVAMNKLERVQHRIAGALTEVSDLRKSTQALLLNEKNALSDLTQIDTAAAIVELQSRQTTLEASSRAYALTSGLSLFNFIG